MSAAPADPGGLLAPLASARGDLSVVRQLIAGQYGKRLLQLRSAADTLAASAQGQVTPQRACYALLARIQREQPEVFRSLLLEPDIAIWLGSREGHPGALGHIAAAAAILTRWPASVTVPVTGGVLFLPGLGQAIIGGTRETAHAVVQVTSDGVSVTGDTSIRLPRDLTDITDCWQPIRRLAAGKDVRLRVRFAADGPIADAFRAFYPATSAPQHEADWRQALAEAWRILETWHPVRAASIAAGIRAIVPVPPAENGDAVSGTHDGAFGAIAASLPSRAEDLAITLVHEFQHAKLAAAVDLVRLHGPDEGARYYAPWRPEPRPLGAMLQGIYAHLGVTQFWATQRQLEDSGKFLRAHVEFVRWRDDTWRACREIAGAASLTTAGGMFVNMLLGELDRLRAEEVAPEARRMAGLIAREQKVSWRLRNLEVDHETARSLAVAWLNGDAPYAFPAGPARHLEVPRAVEGTRLRLLYRHLNGDTGNFPHDRHAADHLYVQGDYRGASDAYEERIVQNPDDLDAWGGLALSASAGGYSTPDALAAMPEVVAEIYRQAAAVRQVPQPPRDLVRWLSAAA